MIPTEKDAAFWKWFGDEPMPNDGQVAARPTNEIVRKTATSTAPATAGERASKAARLLVGPVSESSIAPIAENIRKLAELFAAGNVRSRKASGG